MLLLSGGGGGAKRSSSSDGYGFLSGGGDESDGFRFLSGSNIGSGVKRNILCKYVLCLLILPHTSCTFLASAASPSNFYHGFMCFKLVAVQDSGELTFSSAVMPFCFRSCLVVPFLSSSSYPTPPFS
jgi:hypothetical protein